MKKSGKNLLILAIVLVALVWLFAVPAVASACVPALPSGGATAFGVVSAAAAVVCLMGFGRSDNEPKTEAGMLPAGFAVGYFVVALAMNAGFVLARLGAFNRWLIAANLVLLVGAVILILYADRDAERLSERVERAGDSVEKHGNISTKLGTALTLAKDPEIHKQLLKLKEMVTYSSNVSTKGGKPAEKQMEKCLDELLEMLWNKQDPVLIEKKIQEAETCWNVRNAAGK